MFTVYNLGSKAISPRATRQIVSPFGRLYAYVLFVFVFLLFVVLVIFHFGFECWIWVLIASAHGVCIPFLLLDRKIMIEMPNPGLD